MNEPQRRRGRREKRERIKGVMVGDLVLHDELAGEAMEFYTVVLRQSAGYWVSLCLENGLVGQGSNPEDSISKLKEAIESFQEVYETGTNVYSAPISIEELHEFLTVEGEDISSDIYELRKVYA
ncbi:MAG TPA: hypothetical protein V6D28_19205 [Leptolyngbyaceae cyanobacterium]